ncbi:hypothetical protein HW555_009350 [Spodoptera exigua]|uniref:FLYWCH-type domain-containing protein n=1 Tax=Spodoptera exigua TaxID=7107 RepID=A0A835GD79_SPOEX|nr:hypothetical protein HW555_009350 [Spodoptera exigua]
MNGRLMNGLYYSVLHYPGWGTRRLGAGIIFQLTKTMFSVLLVKGRNGKDLLMMEGYTYYQHKILRDGFRWSCTQMGSRSCRGFLHVNHDMFVLRAFTEHTHPPPWKAPKHSRTKDKKSFKMGKKLWNPLPWKISSIQGRANF